MNLENFANIIFIFGIIAFVYIFLLGRCTANAAEVNLPMSAKIINLTDMPIEEAIAYCDAHNLPCPALRAEYDPITEVELTPWEIEPAAGTQTQIFE